MMDFFKAVDIEVLKRVGHTTYRKGNTQNMQDAQLINDGPLAKTDFWADELAKRIPYFTFTKNHHWQRSGYFSHYTWVKIYKPQDIEKDIYFTIGIDGEEECLVYKLDYQFDITSRLSEAQKEICEKLKKDSCAGWKAISIAELPTYTWSRLIDEAEKFIRLNEAKYDNMIRQACCRNTSICWNEFSWQYPSGEIGKSPSPDSYERIHGYANEEWLFDFSKIIDGYHYGFLESVRQSKDDYIEGIYDIMLWSVDCRTEKRYVIANLRNVEIIKEQDANRAYDEYQKKGWLTLMQKQITAINGNILPVRSGTGLCLFNIRFRPGDVDFMDYVTVEKSHSIFRQAHYGLTQQDEDVRTLISSVQNNTYIFSGNKRSPLSSATMSPKTYVQPAKFVEMQHHHVNVSHKLIATLEVKYGANNVAQENNIGSRRIDAVAHTSRGDIFYEIKTCSSLRASVREAIGQLLEYAFYPDKNNAIRLVIVALGDEKSQEYKDVTQYMRQLRSALNIPIYLMLCNSSDFSFSKEV